MEMNNDGKSQTGWNVALLKRWGIMLGFVISLLSLYLAFHGVQWKNVSLALLHARYGDLMWAFIFLLLSTALAGLRWKAVINRVEVSWAQSTSALVVGLMTNNLLPGRVGEVVRALMLGRKTRVSNAYLIATVVIDRVFDLGVLAISGMLVLAFTPSLYWLRSMTISGGVVLAGILLVVGVLMRFTGKRWLAKLEQIFMPTRFHQHLTALRQEFQLGLKSIKTLYRVMLIIGLSVLIWSLMGLSLFYTLSALSMNLSFRGLVLLVFVLNLGGLIPSSPGYVGTYHFLAILTLTAFGIEKGEAISFSLVSHALWYVPYTLLGLLLLWQQNFALGQIVRHGFRKIHD